MVHPAAGGRGAGRGDAVTTIRAGVRRTIRSSPGPGGLRAGAGRGRRSIGPLVRHRSDARRRRRRRNAGDYRRWERSRSMELWQMDMIGGVRSRGWHRGRRSVTGIDDHSRFCVSRAGRRRATARPVCEALALAMRRHGVPEADLDRQREGVHGPVRSRAPGEVLFDRICRENGIRSSVDRAEVTDHDGEGGTVPQDHPERIPERPSVRLY